MSLYAFIHYNAVKIDLAQGMVCGYLSMVFGKFRH